MQPVDAVRDGYNKMGKRYHEARDVHKIDDILTAFSAALPAAATILDAGSGSGVPVAKFLDGKAHRVTGIDVSATMLDTARSLVPGATFLEMDMTALRFDRETFDAVTCVFALFHVPRNLHARVLASFHHVLKDGGLLLLNNGTGESEGYSMFFGHEMFWSNWSPAITRSLAVDAGFTIDFDGVLARGGEHQYWIVARKGGPNGEHRPFLLPPT